MRVIFIILIVFFAAQVSAIDRVIPHLDLSYDGAFKPPTGTRNDTNYGFNYATGLGWNKTTGKLLAGGASNDSPSKIEVLTVPIVVNSATKDPDDLNAATVVTSFIDVTGGNEIGGGLTGKIRGDVTYLTTQTGQSEDKYYWALFYYYDVSGDSFGALGWTDTDFTDAAGEWRLDNVSTRNWNQSLFEINNTWADTHIGGKYLGMSRSRTNGSFGPSLYAVAPWEDNGGDPPADAATIGYEELIFYNNSTNVMESFSKHTNANGLDAAWVTVGTKQAFVVLLDTCYEHDLGDPNKFWGPQIANTAVSYKGRCQNISAALNGAIDDSQTTITLTDTTGFPVPGTLKINEEHISYTNISGNDMTGCTRGANSTSATSHSNTTTVYVLQQDHYDYLVYEDGYNGTPVIPMLLFYDVDQIAEIAAGTRDSWDIQPYAYLKVDHCYYRSKSSCGLAYDPSNNHLYLAEYNGYRPVEEPYPMYHRFSISSTGSTLDTTAPPPPTDLTMINGTLSWGVSEPNVTYVVFKKYYDICYANNDEFRPITSTTSTSWVDSNWTDEVVSEYQVRAYDTSMNYSLSGTSGQTSKLGAGTAIKFGAGTAIKIGAE